MRILFIAPLPPPITGQSLTSEVLLEHLQQHHQVDIIDLVKKSYVDGFDSFSRVTEIIKLVIQVAKRQRKSDLIYLHVSESLAGNMRDLLFFIVCFSRLPKMVIHLHGGSIGNLLYDKYKILFWFNKFFLKRLAGAIVLGKSLRGIYTPILGEEHVHVVHNFSETYLFSDINSIQQKFEQMEPLRILFMSNLIYGKGHNELLEGFLMLPENIREKIHIDFAGNFESVNQKNSFLEKMSGYDNLVYHGVVSGLAKKQLFHKAHALCFPSFLMEGQGICVLEGYAAGCVVMTTGKCGIGDIFTNVENGYQIQEKSASSIKETIELILKEKSKLLPIAMHNHELAKQQYRTETFANNTRTVLEQYQ